MRAASRPRGFVVPAGHEAATPPEARGTARDGVRLLTAVGGHVEHRVFHELPAVLSAGDLLVVNTSPTLPAALDVTRADGAAGLLHVSGAADDGDWLVEVRRAGNGGPAVDVVPGERLLLPGRLTLQVAAGYPDPARVPSRLWRAVPRPATAHAAYLLRHGRPIHYSHVRGRWPLEYLQNVYADPADPADPGAGSAEMPSAGRPLTTRLLARLAARRVTVAPLALHTGVSSLEAREPPLPEPYRVPAATAHQVSCARAAGHRVVAVGTTAVRALETVTDERGLVHPGSGWTDLVLAPDSPVRTVDGLVTGLHPPEASHLAVLEAVVGGAVVDAAYAQAVARGYLWHEFGDVMLLSKV